jgi:hypothetical protein
MSVAPRSTARLVACLLSAASGTSGMALDLDIEAGQEFEIERLDRGEYRLKRRSAPRNDGVVDWLLACPEKGFLVPIESGSTDTL